MKPLKAGHIFTSRTDISRHFGGSTWRGISYLIGKKHIVLVSGSPSSAIGDHGYADDWESDLKTFDYYGEWHGCNDMEFKGGNAAIVRSGMTLYLVVHEGPRRYVYKGRFRFVGHIHRQAPNPKCGGARRDAIVFRLQRR